MLDKKLVFGLASFAIQATVVSVATYYTTNFFLNLIKHKGKRKNAKSFFKELGYNTNIDLNEYEEEIVTQIINPKNLDVGLSEIGGLKEIIDFIKTDVITLIKNPSLSNASDYYRPPKGILLYGPPGCGKTMLAKAIAKECDIIFINLSVSFLTNKWYGESAKLCNAVFTLAKKLSPCIIFIDEIDTFLRSRSGNDHEVTLMMKSEFLQGWDGFSNDASSRVIIIGATNRKLDIDSAILSRMELQFRIDNPDFNERKLILEKLLKNLDLDCDINLDELSTLSHNLSGRDLSYICREASMINLRQFMQNQNIKEMYNLDTSNLRKVNRNDFILALNKKQK